MLRKLLSLYCGDLESSFFGILGQKGTLGIGFLLFSQLWNALQPLPHANTPSPSPCPAPEELRPSSSISRGVWSHWPLGKGTWVLSQWYDKHNSHTYSILHESVSKYVDSFASKQLIKVDPPWMVKPWETQRLSDLLNHTAFRLELQNSHL